MKRACYITTLVGIIFLLFIILNKSWKSEDNKLEGRTLNEFASEEYLKEKDASELKFYPTIEEAVCSCDWDEYSVSRIEKVVKVIQGEDSCDVFFIVNNKEKDNFYTFKLKTKQEKQKILYSEPLYAVGTSWELEKYRGRELEKRYDKEDCFKQKIISCLGFFNSTGAFSLDKNNKIIKWGLHDNEEIKTLAIDEKRPTEVVKIKMDGEVVYFWYYENLNLENAKMQEINISH
ncbi:hypothetical protein [Velocimicrobium porci]|uniref:Uncharacterized protein n=1 Tax=Velocimicrobium porci TaxID=2606634 RepID=A0A6L5XZ99_9FIRM|nr:hypothetical protein [Velocimicrobium porci]MSS63887.1 hypothetical protein [Velocimicrobium porci]